MKTKFTLTLILISLMAPNLQAQKHNNIKLGFTFDNMFGGKEIMSTSNKFGYAAGYNRNIGSHISIGVFGNVYLSFTHDFLGLSDGYSPANYPNLKFSSADFTQSGYLVGYESKYYFNSLDDDGPNSLYIGMSIQTGVFNQHLSKVKYQNKTTYKDENRTFNDQSFNVDRIGIQFGGTLSNYVSGDFYVSLMYNMSNISNQQFNSPTFVRSLSFGVGYAIGVPF